MRSRPTAAVVALLALTAALTACSGDEEPAGPQPTLPTEAPALWNPCDGLDTAAVSTAFGATFDTRTGTADSPLCSFTPQEDGGPALDVNYQLFAGSLEDLIRTFGVLADGATTEVTAPEVPEADDVRLIVDVTADDTLAVTAFVQTGDLVQVVNALDPSPFDRAAVVRGVRTVMAGLATHAAESDLTG